MKISLLNMAFLRKSYVLHPHQKFQVTPLTQELTPTSYHPVLPTASQFLARPLLQETNHGL